jgi:hypothetical protein
MAPAPAGCRIRHARYLWVALMTCNDAFNLGILHDATRCSPLPTTPTTRRANVVDLTHPSGSGPVLDRGDDSRTTRTLLAAHRLTGQIAAT